jgi:FtsH-binding integral membrane protein
VFVAARSGIGRSGFGVVGLLLGVSTYAVAFAFVERRQRIRANFYFYSSVAIVFILAGTALVLPQPSLAIAWAALGVASGWLARRQASSTLAVHGVVYAVGSALVGGFGDHSIESAFVGPAASWAPSLGPALVLAGLVATGWLTAVLPRANAPERMPRLALTAMIATFGTGLAISWLVPLVAGAPEASAGAVATIRTGAMVAGVIGLAWAGRRDTWLEARWLVYPLLGLTGLKILFEDLPRSRPATLIVTFALYGAGLILVPRLRPRSSGAKASGATGTDSASAA